MIAEDPVWPCSWRQHVHVSQDGLANGFRVPLTLKQQKVERKICAVQILSVISHKVFHGKIDLAYENALPVAVNHCSHFRYNIMYFWTIGVVYRKKTIAGGLAWHEMRIRWIVAILIVFD